MIFPSGGNSVTLPLECGLWTTNCVCLCWRENRIRYKIVKTLLLEHLTGSFWWVQLMNLLNELITTLLAITFSISFPALITARDFWLVLCLLQRDVGLHKDTDLVCLLSQCLDR